MDTLPEFQRPLRVGDLVVAESPSELHLGDFRGQNYIGAFSYLNQDSIIYSSVVGRFTSIGHRVMIGATEHPSDWLSTHPFTHSRHAGLASSREYQLICTDEPFARNDAVTFIGNDVWIGYGVFIRRGVTIGDGAIIGAGSVVTKDVAPYAIVAGTPARFIRPRFDEAVVARLQRLQWWNYVLDKRKLPDIRYADALAALEQIEKAVDNRRLDLLRPKKLVFKRNGATIDARVVGDLENQTM